MANQITKDPRIDPRIKTLFSGVELPPKATSRAEKRF